MTPLSFRSGVLEGGMGVRFPAGLKTLGVVGLLKGACFGMPLSGAAGRTGLSGAVAMTSRDGSSAATSALPALPSRRGCRRALGRGPTAPPASTRRPAGC